MAVTRAPEKALSISVRPASSGPARPAQAAAPAITFDVYEKATPRRDGNPQPVAEPFKNPTSYVKAVEHAEALLKSFRADLAAAEQRKAKAEAEAGAKLAEAVAARDAKQAEASKPLNAAKEAQEARRRELQKPIDDTSAKLAEARADLEIATFPNKRDLDKARNAAHADAASKQATLNAAQNRLDEIVSQIARDESDLASNRSGMAQARASAVVVGANLMSARDEYERARYNAPSQWDWDQMRRTLRSVEDSYDSQVREISNLRDRVADRRRTLDRLLREESDRPTPPPGNDRPTPPSGSDRPTPPSGSDRPIPPSGSDRPTPPSGS
ncbi:MAG: hypothetical protein FJZ01_25995, partial [Candidatus Sericytochromatia bacterium]|nr:hypothetical protein [Candidatus Tanganyikabacteria bacterium]